MSTVNNLSITINDDILTCTVHHPLARAERILLFAHGFPGVNRLPKLAASLNDMHTALVEIHYRGDPASAGRFSFFGATEDIVSVARYLQTIYRRPIHGLGYSAGGLYVARAVREHPTLFQNAMLLCPLVDTEFLRSSHHLPELWNAAQGVLKLHPREFYASEIVRLHAAHNPLEFAAELTTPLYIVQASDDDVLPAADTKKFFDQLTCTKSWREIPHRDHTIDGDEPELLQALHTMFANHREG